MNRFRTSEQQYCRGVKWTDVGSRCSLYRVGPADIKLFNGPEDVPIVGGAVLGGCSTPYAQRLIGQYSQRFQSSETR